jgi:sugar transferase (PEP-CTERM/EpsH1 system associated)
VRLLFLTPQLPYPPHQGTTIRNFNIIAGLARRHHRVHLLSFVTPQDDLDQAAPLQGLCAEIHIVAQPVRTRWQRLGTMLASPLPDMAHRLASRRFEGLLSRILAENEFDVLEFEGIEMMPFVSALFRSGRSTGPGPRIVFDDHNAEYVLQKRVCEADVRSPRRWPAAIYSFVQWKKLARYEAWACRQAHAVLAVSGNDAQALQRIVPGLQVHVVPNGVDVAHYAGFPRSRDVMPPKSLVFTGKMDFRPNVDAVLWFTRQVWPLIRRAVPDVRFYVVGQKPHPRLEPLRQQSGVVLVGRVPDIRPYIANADVYVITLRSGGGTRLKVLEAMAMSCPIVSTSMGCDGFPVVPDRDVLLGDEPETFARQVITLLQDETRRQELGRAGFRFAQAHYDWTTIVPLVEETYTQEPIT